MSAFDQLAEQYLAPELELPPLKRLGSAVLGSGFFGGRNYRNLLRVGSCTDGLVLVLLNRQLLVPWDLVESADPPWGILPREKWLVGADQIPLVVPRGTVQPP